MEKMANMTGRRDFLKGAALVGGAAAAAGCIGGRGLAAGGGSMHGSDGKFTSKGGGAAAACIGGRGLAAGGGSMHGFRVAPMERIRIGFIGLGGRGFPAVRRIGLIPGCEIVAICDINEKRLARTREWIKEAGFPPAREWGKTEDDWKGLCDWDGVDVVYSCTPRPLHCPINVYAMAAGKHVMQEVPGVFSLDECWETVEAAEKHRRHCYMLENCCYGEYELLAFNLVKKGMLGDVVQAEVCYTHDQRSLQYNPPDGVFWRIDRHMKHHGNYYPTHGLVPAGKSLDVNRGDRFETLVSMETKSASFEEYAQAKFKAGDWRHGAKMVKGDVNTCLIRTVGGKILQLKHNVCTPCPYDRGNMFLGTRGMIRGFNKEEYRVCFEREVGDGSAHSFFDADRAEKVRVEYMHPLWKTAGEVARKISEKYGIPMHGGMDFVMDLRWVYCLQNGLPMDTDVYDLATYSSVVELSERSVNGGSRPLEFPDYTRGGWKTAEPFAVEEMDMSKFDFSNGVKKVSGALNA